MDSKKLEKWASLLLDTGKRNNLINFRDTKASTVEVVMPSAEELFSKVESSMAFEVYDPQIADDEDEDYRDHETDEGEDGARRSERLNRDDYIRTYSHKIKRAHQILLYNANVNPVNALKAIDKKARAYIEETGNNVAYMAFGFVHWKDSDSSQQFYRAPILLAPITFSNESTISPWYINMSEDDTIVNPTFSYKIQNEQGITLPEYQDESLSEYLGKIEAMVSKIGWSVSSECKIGIFSFLKMNMYKDLVNNETAILQNNNVRMLLGEPYESDGIGFDAQQYRLDNPLIELHNVVDADSSQIEAIEMAKAGVSFVLQGPPGTGKSQTITNIIAECLNDGKKVLFVSEKQAALNVVFDKLKKAGLEEFCLELHSYKANKKEVIDNLCKTLRASKTTVSNQANEALLSKQKSQKELDDYEAELHKNREGINCSLYQLYNEYAACRNASEIKILINDIESKGADYLATAINLLGQYVDFIPSIGYAYKNNAWYGYINQDTSYQTFEKVKEAVGIMSEAFDILSKISKYTMVKYGVDTGSVSKMINGRNLFHVASRCNIATPAFYNKNQLVYLKDQLGRMKNLGCQMLEIEGYINPNYDTEIYDLDATDYHKRLTRQFNGFFSRLFSSEYKTIMNDIRYYNKSGKKVSYAEAVEVMQSLSLYQQSTNGFAAIEAPIKSSLGSAYIGYKSDWDSIMKEVHYIESALEATGDIEKLASLSNDDYQQFREEFGKISTSINDILMQSKEAMDFLASCFDPDLFDIIDADIDVSLAKMNACRTEGDKLENWFRFQNLLLQLGKIGLISYVDSAIEANIPPEDIIASYRRNFYGQWIDYILHSSDILMSFNRIAHDRQVENFDHQDKLQFEISKAQIRSEIAAKRPSLDLLAAGSAVSVLLREGEKKRKQKSVRKLLEEAGPLIQTIKPCFLMSPLSVSTFLTSENVRFDVVVFDEASQIFPQDAVGAIYRANQLIVVGDSKQMPPSNFFATTLDVDDDDEESGDVTDFESILDLCSSAMSQKCLRWHYRSRFEELIAFSNKNFYGNDLTTFPSSITNRPGVGIDFYFVEGGIFDRKSKNNRKEAEFIVDLVFKNIELYPDRSLGVVAFSISQQDLIDRLISKRRQEDPSKEAFFRRDAQEPFFVKNLETVQGDERDTIIFSVAYAKDSTGRFLHNFGPLNRVGGERRLNVAVTRAKMSVQLVSSIRYMDIDLSRTSAEGSRLLREYLDYAENGQIALERSINVNPFEQFDSPFEEEVCDFLKSHGFDVDTQVGCSNFKIDLGVKRPGTSDYALAIECDGATYHSSKNARDRDRLRQEVLESMGWSFYRIWSTDWFKNTTVEKERLLEAVHNALFVSTQAEIKQSNDVQQEPERMDNNAFVEEIGERHLVFPQYIMANVDDPAKFNLPFKQYVKYILETEAPLAEEWLLKRIVWIFGRDRVTNVVLKEYEAKIGNCEAVGIIRRNGFLYRSGQDSYVLRVPGDNPEAKRDIKNIAPEELAAGMYVIIEQNVSVDKDNLYRSLAGELGFKRLTENMIMYFETALGLISGLIDESDGTIMLRQ